MRLRIMFDEMRDYDNVFFVRAREVTVFARLHFGVERLAYWREGHAWVWVNLR